MLLQVLDDGRLTDNKGVTIDFKNTIIILISSIASAEIMGITNENEREAAVWEELKKRFRPEFLNRLDDVVVFNPLGISQITKIVDNMLGAIQNKLKERDITVELSAEAKQFVANAGFDPSYGARPLKRALYDIVEDSLAELILEDRLKEGDSVMFDVENGNIEAKVLK